MADKPDFITYRSGVIRTRLADNFCIHIEPYLAAAGLHAEVTSMLRMPADQYRIIWQYAVQKGLFTATSCPLGAFATVMTTYDGKDVLLWIWAWCMLLETGLMIAPPVGPTTIILGARKGQIRNASGHLTGHALDLNGTAAGPVIEAATAASPEIAALVSRVLIERANDCTHIDLKDIAV